MANSKKKRRKLYLAVYLGSPKSMSRWEKLSAKEREANEVRGVQGWHQWVMKNRKSIVAIGAPLGSTQKVSRKGIQKIANDMTAYTVVQASSHAEAAKLFKDHPHYMIFPGDSIDVMECLDIPGISG